MSYYSRLQKAFKGAVRLPLCPTAKYVLFSDCHRGIGTSNDNFLKNQTLYNAALKHYLRQNFTYIELGDGDELWENRNLKQIMEVHNEVFCILSEFCQRSRLYMLYGNHDMAKKKDSTFHESIILENSLCPHIKDIYLTHGHQAELLNSTFWRLSRFLVRYLWQPLERYGILDPTSAAKNYSRKHKTENRLHHFASKENHILITGHTHRPVLSETDLSYCNSGSCIHPFSITCIEIEQMHISLIKWEINTRPDMSLYVKREVLAGPFSLT